MQEEGFCVCLFVSCSGLGSRRMLAEFGEGFSGQACVSKYWKRPVEKSWKLWANSSGTPVIWPQTPVPY